MSTPIYVIGSSNTDMVVKAARLPAPGETVLGGTFIMNPGGKGANQAVAAARLGGKVTFVACVGEDMFGHKAIEQFVREKITTDFVFVDKDNPSGVALINVDDKGENSITVAPGANARLLTHHVEAALKAIDGDAIVLLQLETPVDTVAFAIRRAAERKLTVILNPAPACPIDESLYPLISVITPNESEAEFLSGIKVIDDATAARAAEVLHERGVKDVVITMGPRGAWLSSASVKIHVPTSRVKAMDTTAAGDCFSGALAVALSEGVTVEAAVAFASKAAAISVTRMGAQTSMPVRVELMG